jgi:hypothetical protein
MSYVVLVAWLVQAAVGVLLLTGWLRHGRARSPVVLTHVGLSVLGVACWTTFVVVDQVLWAWAALLLITIGNGFGDNMLLWRTRRMGGSHRRLPLRVGFHALFAGVVYFSTLAVCVVATVA